MILLEHTPGSIALIEEVFEPIPQLIEILL